MAETLRSSSEARWLAGTSALIAVAPPVLVGPRLLAMIWLLLGVLFVVRFLRPLRVAGDDLVVPTMLGTVRSRRQTVEVALASFSFLKFRGWALEIELTGGRRVKVWSAAESDRQKAQERLGLARSVVDETRW